MRTVYFAARYTRLPESNRYRGDLEALGFDVTSRWLTVASRQPAMPSARRTGACSP